MSWHRVTRPHATRTSALEVSFFSVVSTAVLAIVYTQLLSIPIAVDGSHLRIPLGSTVKDLAESGVVLGRSGDLIAVDGSVLETAGGEPATLSHNGRPADRSARLRVGDTIETRPGRDRREATVTETEPIPPPARVAGSGPFVRVVDEGIPGVVRVVRGALSGVEVTRSVASEPVPMEVVRTPGDGPMRLVALTFDDGPWPRSTEAILNVLKREKVKATFFVVGDRVRLSPALVERTVREGHEVGNHTVTHRRIFGSDVGRVRVRREVRGGQTIIEAATGVRPRWFRPPGGVVNGVIVDEARRAGMQVVLWDVDPVDWGRPGAGRIVERVVSAVRPGSVVLLHDGGGDRTQTVQALTWIIRKLKGDGYTFVTLEELARVSATSH